MKKNHDERDIWHLRCLLLCFLGYTSLIERLYLDHPFCFPHIIVWSFFAMSSRSIAQSLVKKSVISGYLLTISTLSLSVHYFIKYFICKTIKSFISLESGRSVKNLFPSDMYALLSELSTVCSKPVERHAAILKISKF